MIPRLEQLQQHARTLPHGVRARYAVGCRCEACRSANTRYEIQRYQLRRAGHWNGIVDAAAARAHIKALGRKGLGRMAIAAASDVRHQTIQGIRRGRKLRIRADVERRILAVTPAMVSDRALVSAKRTWKLIDQLLEEGYSIPFLAERLGYKTKKLQLKRHRVTARNAENVARLYRSLTT